MIERRESPQVPERWLHSNSHITLLWGNVNCLNVWAEILQGMLYILSMKEKCGYLNFFFDKNRGVQDHDI
jgi:hypothetical protein